MVTRVQGGHGRAPLWLLVAGGMGISVALITAALLRRADGLQADIFSALTAPAISGMDFVHVHGPFTGAAAGIQLGLVVLLLGSVPAAIVAAALSAQRWRRSRRWSRGWANVFLAGFVFQVSGLALTALLLTLLVWAAAFDTLLSVAELQEVGGWGGALLVSVLCGAYGLRCWRLLQLQTEVAPDRPSLFQRS